MELRLWPSPSAASGSPQVACWTHSLCVWPWGLGVRSPQNGEQSGPESSQPPPAGLAVTRALPRKEPAQRCRVPGRRWVLYSRRPRRNAHREGLGGPGWTWSPGAGGGWVRERSLGRWRVAHLPADLEMDFSV